MGIYYDANMCVRLFRVERQIHRITQKPEGEGGLARSNTSAWFPDSLSSSCTTQDAKNSEILIHVFCLGRLLPSRTPRVSTLCLSAQY